MRIRKASNTIFSFEDGEGSSMQSFNSLANLGISHFYKLFKAPQEASLIEIIKIVGIFPRFVDEEATKALNAPMPLGELEFVLK